MLKEFLRMYLQGELLNLQWLTEKYPRKKESLTICVYGVTGLLALQVLAGLASFVRQLAGYFQSSDHSLQPLGWTLFHAFVAAVLLFGAMIFISGGRGQGRG